MVTLLLNLSAVPDEVAQKFELNYFDSYFNKEILQHMDEFKKQFNERRSVAWSFSNQANIERYVEKVIKLESAHRTPQYLSKLHEEKLDFWKRNPQNRKELALYQEMNNILNEENNI